MIHGNTSGLKPADRQRLERLYRRKFSAHAIVPPEAAREITLISKDLRRQTGLLVDRRGRVSHVIVGDAKGLFIPELKEHPLGAKMLRGLRLVHTHLKGEPLNRDDLTDLSLLRFDAVAALTITSDGLPDTIHVATLKAGTDAEEVTELHPPVVFHRFALDFKVFIAELEDEMGRGVHLGVATDGTSERAILISVDRGPRHRQEESMEELRELASSSGIDAVDWIMQRPARIDPRHLLGKGKLDELVIRAMQLGATLIVFDQDLSPSQGKRITDATELKVIDRSQLILDIFARRAHSREGKVQVELAQLKYRLPRLAGKGTAMSRLMGGIGGRGPGEMKLEIDRRRVRARISLLEKELKSLSRARRQRKAKRSQRGIPIVSIMGYTNAGKSTLLNVLTRSGTAAESRMFATLDTASRRLRFPHEKDVIITDTVGFIRNLPPDLFAAFRSTFEEMIDAHLLIHLVDLSNPRYEQHMRSVEEIILELDLAAKPRLLVFNKIDRVPAEEVRNLCTRYRAIGISALRPETFPLLLDAVRSSVWKAPHSS